MHDADHIPDLMLPEAMMLGLRKLQEYCRDYFSDEHDSDDVLFEFWKIEDDDLFFDVLGFLPLFAPEVSASDTALPEGFRLAYSIFALEDDYNFNGWTALRNKRHLLPDAIAAYERIGMPEEAAALRAAVSAHDAGADDDELGAAYLSVANPYKDEEIRLPALAAFFCGDRSMFVPH